MAQIPVTSTEYLMVPVTGPFDDPTVYPVSIALVPESGGEPATADYKTAQWMNGQAALLITAGSYPEGVYMAWVRVQAGAEDVRREAGRVRIGDART